MEPVGHAGRPRQPVAPSAQQVPASMRALTSVCPRDHAQLHTASKPPTYRRRERSRSRRTRKAPPEGGRAPRLRPLRTTIGQARERPARAPVDCAAENTGETVFDDRRPAVPQPHRLPRPTSRFWRPPRASMAASRSGSRSSAVGGAKRASWSSDAMRARLHDPDATQDDPHLSTFIAYDEGQLVGHGERPARFGKGSVRRRALPKASSTRCDRRARTSANSRGSRSTRRPPASRCWPGSSTPLTSTHR